MSVFKTRKTQAEINQAQAIARRRPMQNMVMTGHVKVPVSTSKKVVATPVSEEIKKEVTKTMTFSMSMSESIDDQTGPTEAQLAACYIGMYQVDGTLQPNIDALGEAIRAGGGGGGGGATGPTGPAGAQGANGQTGPGYLATSGSSIAIGTAFPGFSTQTGLAYLAGDYVRAVSRGVPSAWIEGQISSYSGSTLTLTSILTSGAGTHSDWNISLSGIQGPQGITGATGAQGATAAAGAQGSTGPAGATGAQGATGAGAQGAQGTAGAQGNGGATGPQGPAGAGAQGSQGAQGAIGAQGTAGITGSQGAQGSSGAAGAAGAQGSSGSSGAQGVTGAQGAAGSAGAQGAAGAQGSAGAQGAAGSAGAQGAAGSGAQGAAGSAGAQGAAGSGGAQGASGQPAVITDATTTRTLSSGDNGNLLYFTSGSAITLSMASGLGAAFSCLVLQGGSGQITFSANSQTMTVAGGLTKTAYAGATALVTAPVANTFFISGTLV